MVPSTVIHTSASSRSITESETPDLALLTSALVILFAVAKAGGGGMPLAAGGDSASGLSPDGAAGAGGSKSGGSIGGDATSPELAALADGGAWGAVYDALKGPCMARATELQQANATGGGGKKGAGDAATVSADLTACLDNMARCAEVSLRLSMYHEDAVLLFLKLHKMSSSLYRLFEVVLHVGKGGEVPKTNGGDHSFIQDRFSCKYPHSN